jgi:hypothetical protein
MELGWLDWIAFTVPSIMLFGIAYYFIQGWLKSQENIESQKTTRALVEKTLPLKLQAYERLALFIERIRIDQLILRMRARDMKAHELSSLMLLTIQQEYEHNMSQQIYVSDQLWQIIQMAKAQNEEFIARIARSLSKEASGNELLDALSEAMKERKEAPLQTALRAIRTETQKYI